MSKSWRVNTITSTPRAERSANNSRIGARFANHNLVADIMTDLEAFDKSAKTDSDNSFH